VEEEKLDDYSSVLDKVGGINYDEEFKMTLSWESSNHFNVVIIQDGTFAFIYRDHS